MSILAYYSNNQFTGEPNQAALSSQIQLIIVGLVILGLGILIVVALFVLRNIRQKARYHKQLNMRGLKVTLPKQSDEDDQKKDFKELISLMEPVYSVIQHYYERDWQRRLWQGQPTFSFEIVAHHGEIFFYALCPEDYLGAIEQLIHAQYPDANIEKANDYDLFLDKGGKSAVAALALNKDYIFPIKTYKNQENDPLNSLTNTLSKIKNPGVIDSSAPGETSAPFAEGVISAAIQVVVQPTEQKWQHKIEKALQNVQQGKDFSHSQGAALKTINAIQDIGKTAFDTKGEGPEHNEAQNVSKANVKLTAMQEQQAKLMVEKAGKIGFKTQIRLLARAATELEAKNQVQTMLTSFSQFQSPEANGFRPAGVDNRRLLVDYILRAFSPNQPSVILNTEELTSLFHFPNKNLDTPNVHWLGARRLPPPNDLPQQGLNLGYSEYRGSNKEVFIQDQDRMRHIYMVGQTGTGKTTIFQNMILQDIRKGHGVCYIDPNGDAVEWILRRIPKERAEDVIYFNPADTARPLAMNLLEFDPAFPEQKTMVINELIGIFDKLYDLKATGGPIFEQYMRNSALLVMEDPDSGSTLMEIPKVLADAEFRKQKLAKCRNTIVHDFWVKEAEKAGGEAALANIVPYITSKLTQFTSSDIMRPIVGQQQSAFNFRQIMDEGKILLVSLPKGLLGDMSAQLLGMIISGKIQIAAFSRQNQSEEQRTPFYLYVDEFQNFTSKTFATILSEARKYKLSLNITHQYIEQLDDDTKNAVFGNVGTILSFRIGAPDAEFIQKIMQPLTVEDLINVEKRNYYIRLLIDGAPSKPFNAHSHAPEQMENTQIGEAIRQLSRLKYGRDREVIESEIRLRAQTSVAAPTSALIPPAGGN